MSTLSEDKKIIIFNAPPGAGKDTAVKSLSWLYEDYKIMCVHNKMSEQLKAGVHALFGLYFSPIYYDDPKHAHEKDEKIVALFGMSPREAYISLSEDYLKPKFGPDVFGQMALNKIKKQKADVHAFSDGGFVPEWVPLVDHVGARNVLVVEIHSTRDGVRLGFGSDSRAYIGSELQSLYPDITYRKIYNEFGGHEERQFFKAMVAGAVKKFLNLGD